MFKIIGCYLLLILLSNYYADSAPVILIDTHTHNTNPLAKCIIGTPVLVHICIFIIIITEYVFNIIYVGMYIYMVWPFVDAHSPASSLYSEIKSDPLHILDVVQSRLHLLLQ